MPNDSLGYSALDIAKWFINATDRESGDAITHLKVQKLLYYAQGWALANFDKPLFDEDMEAWAHGPVAVSVYEHFRGIGYQSIEQQKITKRVADDVARLLNAVLDRYGIFSAKMLEAMTHEEAPWRDTRGDLAPEARCNRRIGKDAMKAFFVGRRQVAAA